MKYIVCFIHYHISLSVVIIIIFSASPIYKYSDIVTPRRWIFVLLLLLFRQFCTNSNKKSYTTY